MSAAFDEQVTQLFLAIEQAIEQAAPDIDFEAQNNMLTLYFDTGDVILSRQPALSEIWLACPDGAYHFRQDTDQWVTQKGESLLPLLSTLLSRYGQTTIALETIIKY